MDEKKQIIRSFIPKVALKPMTEEAFKAVPQNFLTEELIGITKFPFRIGRESRVQEVKGQIVRVERPKFRGSLPNNDLYLVDRGQRLNISREHVLIERVGGEYIIVDRGSVCGIKVDEEQIGGDGEAGKKRIIDGDTIHIGCNSTPYIYKFIILEDVWQKAEGKADLIACFEATEADESDKK